MTSPDFRQYVDLTVFDKQPRDIYAESITYAQTALPDLSVRTGTLEDALFQAMSFVSGEVISSINRLPNGLMEGILNLMGFSRVESTYSTGTVEFTLINDSGATIPAGTQVGYTETVDGISTFHTFSTTASVLIPEGDTVSTAVNIIADSAGAKPALLSGQQMVVVSASNKILSAALASDLQSGQTTESDAEYFARATTYLSSLSSSLVTNSQLTSYILTNYLGIHRCRVYDLVELPSISVTSISRSTNTATVTLGSGHGITSSDVIRVYGAIPSSFNGIYDVDTAGATTVTYTSNGSNASTTTHGYIENFSSLNASAVAEVPGSVTVFVAAEGGASVSAADKSAVLSDIQDRMVAGLTTTVVDAIIVPISVAITIKTAAGFASSVVGADVEAFLESELSPNGWSWEQRIRVNQMIARVTQLSGVDYVTELTFTIDSGYENLAVVDGNGDIIFVYYGSLPSASVAVSEYVGA